MAHRLKFVQEGMGDWLVLYVLLTILWGYHSRGSFLGSCRRYCRGVSKGHLLLAGSAERGLSKMVSTNYMNYSLNSLKGVI